MFKYTMRVNRAKAIRKYLRFFRLIFGISPRYNILLDGNFIFAALKYKVDITERLTKLLQNAEVRLFILQTSLDELEVVGEKAATSLAFAKSFCEILNDKVQMQGDTLSDKAYKFLDSQVNPSSSSAKTRRYILASQDKELRSRAASLPGVPIIYLNKVALVLEPPSDASLNYNKRLEASKSSLKARYYYLL